MFRHVHGKGRMEMTIFLYDVALPTRLQCERGVVDRGGTRSFNTSALQSLCIPD